MRDYLRKLAERIREPAERLRAVVNARISPRVRATPEVRQARFEALRERPTTRLDWRRWFQLNRKRQRQIAAYKRAVGGAIPPKATSLPLWLIHVLQPLLTRSPRLHLPPTQASWRSLKRAVNGGWTPPQPSREEMQRHAWFRKAVNAAALRIHVGQELPGDRELVGA